MTPTAPTAPPSPPPPRDTVVHFGPFELDTRRGMLWRAATTVALPPRPFALLCYLARHAGRVVPKDELLDAVWGHQHLGESALKATVNILRRALGEDGKGPRWIVSVARRGYCLNASDSGGPPASTAAGTARGAGATADDLFGRDAELAQLALLADEARLVTVLGPAGIGKTRLALAALPMLHSRCADGVALIRLQGLRSGADLVSEIAQACALPDEASRSAASLAGLLSRRRQGLLLDSCEHLAQALTPLLEQLLAHAPGLHILATSQVPLGVHGEQTVTLQPLALPPPDGSGLEQHAAAMLFICRLRRTNPGLAIAAPQAPLLAAVCRALDGVPLELELAAARVPLLGLEGVHAHLQDRLQLLRQDGAGVEARHRSLQAAISWSHELLDEPQRQLLRRLSVFEASFSAAWAQGLMERCAAGSDCPSAWAVLDILGALASRCLIAVAEPEPAAAAAPAQRWRLLQSMRLFAAERLAAAGEAPALHDAHLQLMIDLLRRHAESAHDTPIRDWAAAIVPALPDVRSALRHAVAHAPQQAWTLWALTVPVWVRGGLPHEASRWHEVLQAAGVAPEAATVRAPVALALALMCLYNLPVNIQAGAAAAEEAVALFATLGSERGAETPAHRVSHYHALYVQGQLHLRRKLSLREQGTVATMQALETPDWSPMRLRYRRMLQAYALAQEGQTAAFRRSVEHELALANQMGNRDYIWNCRHSVGQALFAGGEIGAATDLFVLTWREIDEAGVGHVYWSTRAITAMLLAARDASSAASEVVGSAVHALWQNQQLHLLAAALPWLGWWRAQPQEAAQLLGWAQAQAEQRGERPGPIAAWLAETLAAKLASVLSEGELAAARGVGAAMPEAQAMALALGA